MMWTTVTVVCCVVFGFPMLGFASVDVVSLDCEAVCQQELLFERHCAVQMGCYEPNILANDLLFIQCWQPCWENSNNCLSLCREQHAAIKDRCRKQCADIPEDKFCPGFCFAMAIDTLMNGQNHVKPPGSPPTGLPTTVETTTQAEKGSTPTTTDNSTTASDSDNTSSAPA